MPDTDCAPCGRMRSNGRGPSAAHQLQGGPTVLVHMIEEYARHNGHADLLREAVDVETGE